MSARWYVIPPGNMGEPLVSPLSGEPYVFHAGTKGDAVEYVARVWPGHPGLIPRSVAEHEAMRELTDAATRAKQYDDGLLAYAKTLPVPEEYDEEEAGQMSLCSDPALWRVAA